MAAVLKVHVEYVGHEVGHWCNQCMLSTGARLWWTTTTNGDTTLRQCLFCVDCESHDITVSDDAEDATNGHIEAD